MPSVSASLRWSHIRASLRRSEIVVATTRAICCVMAISVPYVLFVLETALHP